MRLFQQRKCVLRVREAGPARRAEEHHCVLDFFPAKARERVGVLGKDAQNTSVRTVEKFGIEIRQRGRGLRRPVLDAFIAGCIVVCHGSSQNLRVHGQEKAFPAPKNQWRSRYRAASRIPSHISMNPKPETAPRTNPCISQAWSAGQRSRRLLSAQSRVQGIITSIKPSSMQNKT